MKKLLIVDNSTVIINILKDLFSQKNDFNIYIAKSLEEVENLINTEEFFAVISNSVLPDALNGELLELLKDNDIPTVILSSIIDNEISKVSNNSNVIDYVLKDSIYGLEYIYTLIELLVFIRGLNVLIVKNYREESLRIKYVLESLFLNVKFARNGNDALEIVENYSDISLIITDYDVPSLNGLELTKVLRKDDKYANIPILMLSDEVDDELKIKLFKTGINDFITTPILEEELKAKVINLFLNTKRLEEINTFNRIFDNNIISSSTDTKGVITSVSSAFSKISGYSKNELIGKHHNIVRHPDMPSSIYEDLWGTIKEGKTWKGEIKNLRKDGSSYWVSAVIEPILDKQKNKIGYYAVRQDITDKKRIYELSITDGLTSLYNRRYFNDIAKSVIDKTVRNNEVFAFMSLDIDNFKKYNDTYGHQEGDTVLISISNSLKESFKRNDDLIFRLGGEEFGVLINAKKEEDILELASKAKKNIEDLKIEHKENIPSLVVTASFGVLIIPINHQFLDYNLDHIYKEADDKLYEAKENGRNRIEYKIL